MAAALIKTFGKLNPSVRFFRTCLRLINPLTDYVKTIPDLIGTFNKTFRIFFRFLEVFKTV